MGMGIELRPASDLIRNSTDRVHDLLMDNSSNDLNVIYSAI